jgi:MoxR-like ATPase
MKPTSNFHIVHKPESWQQHDEQPYLQQLSDSADKAKERNLEKSAERYRPSKDLLNAINAALAARAPLLLTGEPGTGKTQVASFLQRFFNIKLFEYQVRSNSQSADLRYDFDAVAYLRDAYLAKNENPNNEPTENPQQDPRSNAKYLKKGPLWKAYEHDSECILLIDEIDKAPRDFPNDLLQEIDQHRFAHPFHQGENVKHQGTPPIIIITSNGERRLPDAFLRRCIVHHIEIDEILEDIMQAWGSQFPKLTNAIRQQALKRFREIRTIPQLSKKPGAAELLLWLTVLSAQNITADAISDSVAKKDLPALLCLIKDHTDYKHLD